MADTRMIVLALSPRAATAVKDGLVQARCDIGSEYGSGDPDAVSYGDLLDLAIDELGLQLGELAPEKVANLAERMAQAGLAAVTP